MIRVLVVDDQQVFRRSAAALVRATPGFEVAGDAATGEQAIDQIERLRPDLVLMDVRLPGVDGIEATRRILLSRPETTVVLISTYDAADLPGNLTTCGAAAFVRKQDLDPAVLTRLGNPLDPHADQLGPRG